MKMIPIAANYNGFRAVIPFLDVNVINFLVGLKPLLNEGAVINIYVPSLDLLLWGYANCDLLGTLQNAHNFLFDEFTSKAISIIAGFKIINCVATNLVLRNSQNSPKLIPDITKLNRGKKVVEYLKFVERSSLFRKKIGRGNAVFKKFYCLARPSGCYKRFAVDYFGKI